MKKNKIIILLIFGVQLFTKAQPYIPMPTTNAVWTISTLSQGAIHDIYKYAMYGDTLINNVIYKKIYENHDFNFDIASSNTFYRGAIREYAKKIYKINPGTTTEGLLYNFNLTIGDTVKSITKMGSIAVNKVIGLNFIVYNGITHRKWILQGGEYWLEGIGSSYGLINPLDWGFDWCESLVCMSIDGTVQYQNTNPTCSTPAPYNCDGGFVSVNELSAENNRSLIFPNPFSNAAIIKTSTELNNATFLVYDILGQEVLKETNLNGQEIKINKGNLNSGNYNYHLTQNGDLVSKGKFIVE